MIAIENPPAAVAAPAMSPAPGGYAAGQTVTLSGAPGATIYYAINGGTATQYSTPISLTTNATTTTITAYAVVAGVSSSTASGMYSIDVAALEPVFGPTHHDSPPSRVFLAAADEVSCIYRESRWAVNRRNDLDAKYGESE